MSDEKKDVLKTVATVFVLSAYALGLVRYTYKIEFTQQEILKDLRACGCYPHAIPGDRLTPQRN
jgi:hypothetical protein